MHGDPTYLNAAEAAFLANCSLSLAA